MGGILSGLIGGIARGAVGGYTAEGERRRKEEEFGKNLLARFHMNALEDWEHQSPESQEFHLQGMEKLFPKIPIRQGVMLGHAVAKHVPETQPSAAQGPRTAEFGERPIDIPHNVQDLTPQKLPAPAIAPNAPLRAAPTMESVLGQMGASDPYTRTHGQEETARAELFKMNQARTQREEARAAQQQEYSDIRTAGQELKLPPDKIAAAEFKKRTGYDITGGGSWSTTPMLYTDPAGGRHEVIQNNKTRQYLDRVSGNEMETVPSDWTQTPRPVDRGDAIVRTPEGGVQLVSRSGPTKGKVTPTEARGFRQYPPTKTVTTLDEQGNRIQRVLTSPEAVAESRKTGGFASPTTMDANRHSQAQRILTSASKIRPMLTELQSRIGPFAGRLTEAEIKAGRIPGFDARKARELDAAMKSFAALQPALHQFRSQKAFEDFRNVGPRWGEDPEMALGALDALEDLAKSFLIPGKGSIGAPPTAGAPTAGAKKSPEQEVAEFEKLHGLAK